MYHFSVIIYSDLLIIHHQPRNLSLYIIIIYYSSVYLSFNLLSLRHKLPSVGNLACGCLVTRSSSSVPRPCHLLTSSIIHSGDMSSRVPQLTYFPSIFNLELPPSYQSIIHSGDMSSQVPQLTYIPSVFNMGIATF